MLLVLNCTARIILNVGSLPQNDLDPIPTGPELTSGCSRDASNCSGTEAKKYLVVQSHRYFIHMGVACFCSRPILIFGSSITSNRLVLKLFI